MRALKMINLPPETVVVGVPAKFLKQRFTEGQLG